MEYSDLLLVSSDYRGHDASSNLMDTGSGQ